MSVCLASRKFMFLRDNPPRHSVSGMPVTFSLPHLKTKQEGTLKSGVTPLKSWSSVKPRR